MLNAFSDINQINEKYDLELFRRTEESFQNTMPRSHAISHMKMKKVGRGMKKNRGFKNAGNMQISDDKQKIRDRLFVREKLNLRYLGIE
jgi:hypothetical protein